MSGFKALALSTFDDIFNLIESSYDDFEIDFEDENLKIENIENNKIYILSIHSPTEQIWVSSPISGAHHFKILSKDPLIWHSTRDNSLTLFDLISKELS